MTSITALRATATTRGRVELAKTMTSTATILRLTSVRDASGGFVDVHQPIATVPCTFAPYPIRPREFEYQPRIQEVREWFFNFPVGTSIVNTDRVAVGSRTFEVINSGASPYELCAKATCLEIL